MWVQAVDGKFYLDPVVEGHDSILQITDDDGIRVKHKGGVTWNTARRKMAGEGVKSTIVREEADSTTVLNSRFTSCSVFTVKLRGRIPVPQNHSGVVATEEDARLLDAENVLAWKS